MGTTEYAGIDYGHGRTNIDKANGIRYGCISQGSVMLEAIGDMEMVYPPISCPECGQEAKDQNAENYKCACGHTYTCYEATENTEAIGMTYDREGYKLKSCLDSDIIITLSPYYTHAQFCSPCIPGAGSLDNPCEDGPKTYCLGHDWFDDEKAPYPVFSVTTDEEVKP